jgi:cell division septum initiation protein DivIVA
MNRQLRNQIQSLKEKMGKEYPTELDSIGNVIIAASTNIEEQLVQTKAKSGQDLLNYPIRLNDQLLGIFHAVQQNTAPSAQSREAYADIRTKLDVEFKRFETLTSSLLRDYNRKIRLKGIDFIQIKK